MVKTGVPPGAMRTVAFCDSLLPLQRPVSVASRHGQFARRLSAARYFPAPPAGVPPVSISHGSLLRFVTSLTRPVSFYVRYRAFSCFQSTAWEQGTPKSHKPKRGQRLKPTTRAKAKGQSRLVPPGGFSRGEQFERERVVPPLSRTTFHTFLPEQESMAAGRQYKPI